MQTDYQHLSFDYLRSLDQSADAPVRHPVIVVGAGPVGLSVAIDLARQGVRTLLLDDDHTLSNGSRAICFAKRTLDIWDRLGVGERMVDKGVSWNVGKVFFRDELVYRFDLLPEPGHRRPAFINLQQYYAEGFLLEAARALPQLEIRWRNRVTGIVPGDDGVELSIDTPDGPYRLRADWLVAADGARSPLRGMMGLESKGRIFRDRFLIADVKMAAPFPTERWFWFDPPFHRNQSVLLHRQPDDVWRIDFQLGWDADPVLEKQPERVIPRVQALLGADTRFTLEWVSVYTFACLRMERFRHGRVLFTGDAAHGVSPFGARGANSGVQDAENLAWKLGLVLTGRAPDELLDTYDAERVYAADENLLNSTRATDFITPKTPVSRMFRDAVLELAKTAPFARRIVNSGRLSVPATLHGSALNTPDVDAFGGPMVPGAPAMDAPVTLDGHPDWLLGQLAGGFVALWFVDPAAPAAVPGLASALAGLQAAAIPVRPLAVVAPGTDVASLRAAGVPVVVDAEGLAASRYDARGHTVYLLRPDQHVCMRRRVSEAASLAAELAAARDRATCNRP